MECVIRLSLPYWGIRMKIKSDLRQILWITLINYS